MSREITSAWLPSVSSAEAKPWRLQIQRSLWGGNSCETQSDKNAVFYQQEVQTSYNDMISASTATRTLWNVSGSEAKMVLNCCYENIKIQKTMYCVFDLPTFDSGFLIKSISSYLLQWEYTKITWYHKCLLNINPVLRYLRIIWNCTHNVTILALFRLFV